MENMELEKNRLKRNPRETANLISVLFFGWAIPFFKIAYKKTLDPSDVYEPTSVDHSCVLGNRLERYLLINLNRKRSSSS